MSLICLSTALTLVSPLPPITSSMEASSLAAWGSVNRPSSAASSRHGWGFIVSKYFSFGFVLFQICFRFIP